MGNIYTISELCDLLSVTRPIVEKKLKRLWNNEPVTYTSTMVNNREIKAIELSENQERMLGIANINNTSNEAHINTPSEQPKVTNNSDEMVYRILEYSEKYNTRFESYIERIVNAEKQVKLLEYSESKKENEYLKQAAELKTIKSQHKRALIIFTVSILSLSLALILSLTYFLTKSPEVVKVPIVKLKPIPANMMKYYINKKV